MNIDELASFLRVSAQPVNDESDEQSPPTPEPAPEAQQPAKNNWAVFVDTVGNKNRDTRLRKTAWKKLIGTMNRTFPIVKTARNKEDLTKEMVARVNTLADLVEMHPGICKSNNVAPGMHEVLAHREKIEPYVRDRVNGRVDGRLRPRFNAHYFDLFTQGACVMLESFKITSLDALQTACSKMTSLELLRGSVSARSLLVLLSTYMQISSDTVLQIVNTKDVPEDLGSLAFAFFSNVKKRRVSECVLHLYECSLAQLSDLRLK